MYRTGINNITPLIPSNRPRRRARRGRMRRRTAKTQLSCVFDDSLIRQKNWIETSAAAPSHPRVQTEEKSFSLGRPLWRTSSLWLLFSHSSSPHLSLWRRRCPASWVKLRPFRTRRTTTGSTWFHIHEWDFLLATASHPAVREGGIFILNLIVC